MNQAEILSLIFSNLCVIFIMFSNFDLSVKFRDKLVIM